MSTVCFVTTAYRAGQIERREWDTNPTAHAPAPKNGWVHPFVFYKADFASEKFAYSLLNVDVDAGKVKERMGTGRIRMTSAELACEHSPTAFE